MKKNETDGTTRREETLEPIPFSKCVLGKNFPYKDQKEIEDFHVEDFYCPDTDRLIV
jgi:hypothetical protein